MDEIIALIGLSFGSICLGWLMSTEWRRYSARQFWIEDDVFHCAGPISREDAMRICEAWRASEGSIRRFRV